MGQDLRTDVGNLPNRDWNKKLETEWKYRGHMLRIFSVTPQAHLIGVTKPVGLLADFSTDVLMVKAFQKNYHTEAGKPGVVSKYGFEQKHGEPIELIDFVYECIFDRACEAEMNRYRMNSKNYESSRYVDLIKIGLTVVFPDDVSTPQEMELFIESVVKDLENYTDVVMDSTLHASKRKQAARRRLGTYQAVECVYKANLRSLTHMATQRSAEYSPNGKEAEPQISSVVTQMLEDALPHIPVFGGDVLKQVEKGYR